MKIVIALILVIAAVLLVVHLMRQTRSEPTVASRDLHASTPEPGAADKPSDVPPSVSRHVVFTIPNHRQAICDGEALVLPAGTVIEGDLTLELSDGPLGVREYDHPGFLNATLVFTFGGRGLRYSGFVSQWDLWAPDDTHVTKNKPDFEDHSGQLDGMMDGRDDWSYVLPDGSTHTNRLKYTSCHFWIMVKPSVLDVKCRYYDQNSDIADYVTIFYSRPLTELLLLKDTRIFKDSEGNPEDYSLHDGETITLERL